MCVSLCMGTSVPANPKVLTYTTWIYISSPLLVCYYVSNYNHSVDLDVIYAATTLLKRSYSDHLRTSIEIRQ